MTEKLYFVKFYTAPLGKKLTYLIDESNLSALRETYRKKEPLAFYSYQTSPQVSLQEQVLVTLKYEAVYAYEVHEENFEENK